MSDKASAAQPWTLGAGHVLVTARLTPKSSRDALEGVETLSDGRAVLKARVRAVPEDGKANDALIKLVAKALGAPRSHVSIVTGATSRLKTIRVDGSPAELSAALEQICA